MQVDNIIKKITNILYYIPNMNRDCMAVIIDPIDTIAHAKRLLNFLEKNQGNPEIMRVSYLLKNNHEIIGNSIINKKTS